MKRPEQTEVTLLEKEYVSETIIKTVFAIRDGIAFTPGQFVNVNVTPPYRRPYSVVEYKDGKLTLLIEVRHSGKGADFFRNIQIGQKTQLMAFLGRFTLTEALCTKVFISTGTGVAPFISMIKELSKREISNSSNLFLLQGMRYLKDDIAFEFIQDLINKKNVTYVRCVSREQDFNKEMDGVKNSFGRVTNVITTFDFDWKHTEFYICGGHHMIEDVKSVLINKGVISIFTEDWG